MSPASLGSFANAIGLGAVEAAGATLGSTVAGADSGMGTALAVVELLELIQCQPP